MTILKSEIRVSPEAIAAARTMGIMAAKADNWMQPTPEDHISEENCDDIGAISEEHKDSWCGTDHFKHHYHPGLNDLANQEEVRLTGRIGGLSHLDLAHYEGLYIPLRDAFFEAWEEETKFYEKAETAIEEFKA